MKTINTIIAHSTPQGSGALAVIRLSGPEALVVADSLARLPGQKKLLDAASHTLHFGWVLDRNNTKIDQVIFSIMHAPRTFTGEHVVEITCHNNQFIIEAIIHEALFHGARIAKQGEFTEQAFVNGKLDLVQAEALNDLIHAQTQLALKKSLSQLEGTLSHWIHELEQQLLRALAWCEASFEFLDEELEFGIQIREHLEKLLERIAFHKGTYDIHRHIREGVRIALIGSVNAGKSSIFNMLLGQQRAIVTPVAGTTRDSIEAGFILNGIRITLIDTAGIRITDDIVEQEGIKRSFDQAQLADMILLVFDGSRALTEEELSVYKQLYERYENKIVLVQSKSDLPEHAHHFAQVEINKLKTKPIQVTASDLPDMLKEEIAQKLDTLFKKQETPFLLNERQFRTLTEVEQLLNTIANTLLTASSISYELVSFHLREALEQLTGLTGKSISQAALDQVFREFCVGK